MRTQILNGSKLYWEQRTDCNGIARWVCVKVEALR